MTEFLEAFDWATGGRALSKEEITILRRELLEDGKGELVREPQKMPKQYCAQE